MAACKREDNWQNCIFFEKTKGLEEFDPGALGTVPQWQRSCIQYDVLFEEATAHLSGKHFGL